MTAKLRMMFTKQQTQTLRATVNRIIPADDYPNGWDAGVGDFLLRLLTLEPRFLPLYQDGLAGLDEFAQAEAGQPFAALGNEAQDSLLTRLEDSPFFRLLVTQTMEGYYADPGNGGNKDGISWQMIGFQVTA